MPRMAKKTATVSQDASKSCKGAVGGARSAASDAVSDNAQHGSEAHSSHDGGASPAVSVIIPVYNVERYLRECLESVLAQTLRGIEVVCVNDGSTDSSLSIMREYEARDPRVRVVDKPNGGYGHSVNRGLSEARGEYVAVVEPDDFIDAHMYEDLMAAACLADGTAADVVKSAYWNYYDVEGEPPHIEAPNLMNCMPAEQFQFTAHTHWEVLYHHPSIWSAIYRRAFLEERGIRMIEPKGAGWADNPFFFETLCQAQSIVWMPGAYYHYRQTNPHASSYLKDFQLPFDRLRDIRALLDRIGEHDPHVLVCFYNRTFSYIKSVLEKFGFPESDSEVFGLIREALAAMNSEVLYGAKRGIRRDQIEYYEDVMGVLAERVKPRAAAGSPRVSVVVSMKDVRPYVWGCLDSLAKQAHKSLEVICVDCASSDRTRDVASYFPGRDKRFSVIEAGEVSIPQGFAAGLARARGEVVYFADPRNAFGKKFLAKIVRALDACPQADMVVFGKKLAYLDAVDVPEKNGVEVEAAGMRDRLMLAAPNGVASKAFRRGFIQSAGLAFDAEENAGCTLFSTKAIAAANRVALMNGCAPKRQSYRSVRSPLAYIEKRPALAEARSAVFGKLREFEGSQHDKEVARGIHCYIVEAMLADLSEMGDLEDERRYFELLKGTFGNMKSALNLPSAHFINAESYRKLQRLASMNYEQYLRRETVASRDKARVMSESTAYRIGTAIATFGPRLLPKGIAMRVRKMV